MNISEYATPLIALVGTLFGGAGLEFIRRWLGKAKEKDDTATNLRNELRIDLRQLKQDMEALEKEVTEWRDKYYALLEDKMTVEHDLMRVQFELQRRAGSSNE